VYASCAAEQVIGHEGAGSYFVWALSVKLKPAVAVSPHVISTVRFLLVFAKRAVKIILIEEEISLILTETITLQVESDVARFYNDAPPTDKQKLQALFGNWLKHYAEADVDSLKQTMDEISRNANSRGLTPEILDSLLADE